MSGRDFRLLLRSCLPDPNGDPVTVKLMNRTRVINTVIIWPGNRDVSHVDLQLPITTDRGSGRTPKPETELYARAPDDYLTWSQKRRATWIRRTWKLNPESLKDMPEITRRLRTLGLVASE